MLAEMMAYIFERSEQFTTSLGQHLSLTFISLFIAVALGLLFGILSTRLPWLRSVALAVGNIGRTIPSLAVLALALPLLGIGGPPTILALVFIGALPVLLNTIVGIEQVDEAVKEAARGMGMNDLQVLLRVEVPIASAVIMAGVRTAAVVVVASATLAAFIGGGGLGDLILRGHALNRDHIMLAGAIPATLLAFYFEEMFGRLQEWATPRGLQKGKFREQSQAAELLSLLATIAVLPLVFGLLLAWESFRDGEGARIVLTGLHPEYRMIGLPALLLSLVAALWPRRPTESRRLVTVLATTGAGVLGALWMITGFILVVAPGLLPGHSLQPGIFLQLGAAIFIGGVTVWEVILGRQTQPETAPPVEGPVTQLA